MDFADFLQSRERYTVAKAANSARRIKRMSKQLDSKRRRITIQLVHAGRLFGLHLRHALSRLRRLGSVGRCTGLLRSVLRRALCLQLLGVKNPVVTETAISQSLRIVFEGVRRRLCPRIVNRQVLIL